MPRKPSPTASKNPTDKIGTLLIDVLTDAQVDSALAAAGVVKPTVPWARVGTIRNKERQAKLVEQWSRQERARTSLRDELSTAQTIVDQLIRNPLVGEHSGRSNLRRDALSALRAAGYRDVANHIEAGPPWTVNRLVGELLVRTYARIADDRAIRIVNGVLIVPAFTDAKVGAVPFIQKALLLLRLNGKPIRRMRSAIHEMILEARRPKRSFRSAT